MLLSLAVARELELASVAMCRRCALVAGGAVERCVESAEWRGSLSRVVDGQRRGNALGVWRLYAKSRTYIQTIDYNNAKNKATGNDYSRFIKHVAVSIIGNEELKRSSVTGRGCNCTKTSPKPALNKKKLVTVMIFCNN